jgi:hypothetical protein
VAVREISFTCGEKAHLATPEVIATEPHPEIVVPLFLKVKVPAAVVAAVPVSSTVAVNVSMNPNPRSEAVSVKLVVVVLGGVRLGPSLGVVAPPLFVKRYPYEELSCR